MGKIKLIDALKNPVGLETVKKLLFKEKIQTTPAPSISSRVSALEKAVAELAITQSEVKE